MASIQEKLKSLADNFFGGDMTKAEAVASAVMAQGKELETAGVAFKEDAATETKAEETKAEDIAGEEVKAEGDMTEEVDVEETDSATFVGDMTPDEFAKLIAGAIAEAIAPLMGQMNEAKAAAESVQKELSTSKETSGKAIIALDQRVKELEGDAPKGGGFRASAATETVKEGVVPVQPKDEFAQLADWLVAVK